MCCSTAVLLVCSVPGWAAGRAAAPTDPPAGLVTITLPAAHHWRARRVNCSAGHRGGQINLNWQAGEANNVDKKSH